MVAERRYLYIGGPLDGQRLSDLPSHCPACGHHRRRSDAACDYNANERHDLLRGTWAYCGCSNGYHFMTRDFSRREEYVTYNNAVKSPTSRRDVAWALRRGEHVYETVIKVHFSVVQGGV